LNKSHSHKKLDSAGWGKKNMLFTLAINVLKRYFPDIKLIFTPVSVLQHVSNNV